MQVIDKDPDAKRQGYTAWSYIMCLQKDLGRYYVPGTFFQQDNAPIYIAK